MTVSSTNARTPHLRRPVRRPVRRSLGGLCLAVLGVTALSSCGAEADDAPVAAATGGGGIAEDQLGSGLPDECLDAFPVAVGEPDLADLGGVVPADWPEPPIDAVLCQTSGTLDDNVHTAAYATSASEDEVLAAYEQSLARYDAVREDQGSGEMVWGTAGDVAFQVTARPGAFTVFFGSQ